MIAPDRPGQHRDNFGSEPSVDARKVNPGPISLTPGDNETFANAISLAGGTIAPLSTETKGLIWLSQKHSKELARTSPVKTKVVLSLQLLTRKRGMHSRKCSLNLRSAFRR